MYGTIDVSGSSLGAAIAPMNVKNIQVVNGSNNVIISWQDPEDTIVEGELLCAWAGTKVVQKIGSCPQNIYDGALVIDNKVRNNYENEGFKVNNLENGQTYYFAFFPYSDKGIQNKKVEENSVIAHPVALQIYGIRRNIYSSDPSWERLENAIGKVATATLTGESAQNDFDDLYPWSEIISYNYDSESNKINAYYGDATFKFDGSNGDVYTKIPEFWWKKVEENLYEYIYIATTEVEGYTKSEEFSVGRYLSSGDATRLYSKSGVSPLAGMTRPNLKNACQGTGNNIGLMDYRYFLLQLLYLVEYANYDSQSMLGFGISTVICQDTGGCDSLGMKSGSIINDSAHSVLYRGVEDIFGNLPQVLDGINKKSYNIYVSCDPNTYSEGVYGAPYIIAGVIPNKSGWISKQSYNNACPLAIIPSDVSGSSTTYFCDNFTTVSTGGIFCVGRSSANIKEYAGLFSSTCTASSPGFGSRLLKY